LSRDGLEEEADPRFVRSLLSHCLEAPDVLVSVPLQVPRQVKEGCMEHASFDEIEVDEEPSQPSVAVQEGVDGLELVVKERAADENRKRRLLVEEPLEIRHRIGYELGRRCNEDCLGWTSTADPVRRRPEVTRRPFLPANVPEQLGMHLSDEPIAERQFGEALESDLERAD